MISSERAIPRKLASLNQSKFRSKFKLTQKDRDYIATKSLETIKEHAFQFINSRVAPDFPKKWWQTNTDERASGFHRSTCNCHMLSGMYFKVAWDRKGQGAEWGGDWFCCSVDYGVDWATDLMDKTLVHQTAFNFRKRLLTALKGNKIRRNAIRADLSRRHSFRQA